MAVYYYSEVIGTVVVTFEGNDYTLEIRKGNCLGVVIHSYEQDSREYATLFTFFADETHLKNLIKEDVNMFSYPVKQIRLNTYYKEAMKIAKYLVKKFEVTLFYKQIK